MTEEDLDDLRTIIYFWQDKGDPERCCSWADQKELLQEHFPEVLAAWHRLKIAEKTMNAVIDNMSNKIYDLESELEDG